MKANQIATAMNTVFPEVIGGYRTTDDGERIPETIVLKDDLSNVVEFGKKVDSQFKLGDNFNTYFKKFADCIGLTVMINDEYDKEDEFNIRKLSTDVGSIVRMAMFKDGDFQDNTSWDEIVNGSETAPPTFDDMFGYHPVDADAIYFNKKVTLESEPYTVTYLQWKSATTSASQLQEFANMIEERWINKMRQLKVKLRKMLVSSWIVNKYNKGMNGVFNILAEYKKKFPNATTTTATASADGDFLRFMKAFIEITREDLRDRTYLFNPEGYVGSVPRSRQKMFLYAPYSEYMSVWLYSDKFHDDYVKLGGYDTVSNWQANGTARDDDSKMTVHVQLGNVETTIKGVIGIIFDDRAIFTVDEYPRTVAQENSFSEWTNYKHKYDVSLYSTDALNGAIFVISDYDFVPEIYGLANAPTNWATIITNGIYTQNADGTFTKVATGATYSKTAKYFKEI